MAEPQDEQRLAVVAAHNALELLLEWDKARNFIVPYKVRDPLHAAMKQLRAVLASGVPAADERQQFEAAMGEALKTDQGAYALSRAHLPDQPYTFLATKWAWSAWQRALGVTGTDEGQPSPERGRFLAWCKSKGLVARFNHWEAWQAALSFKPDREPTAPEAVAWLRGDAHGVAPTAPTPRPATVAEAQHAAEIGACLPNGVLFDAFGNPRTRYTRVIADGSTCVCDDVQVREWREDEARTPGTYVFQDVYLSKEEFDGLPEFDGF